MSNWLDTAIRRFQYGVRVLCRVPGLTVLVVVTLAVGIGANAGVFTLANAVLLHSLPVSDPQELYFVEARGERGGGSSYPLFQALRGGSTQLSDLGAFQLTERRVTIDGQLELATVEYASGNLFQLLGVGMRLGRAILPADDRIMGAGGADGPVAVISHQFWQRRFGERIDVIGKAILVGEVTATIVGITARSFTGLQP